MTITDWIQIMLVVVCGAIGVIKTMQADQYKRERNRARELLIAALSRGDKLRSSFDKANIDGLLWDSVAKNIRHELRIEQTD